MVRKSFLWAAAVLVLWSLPGVQVDAKTDKYPFPADLLDGNTYPGLRGVVGKLEFDGDNVHNCGNLLLHITNFGLIGARPGSNFRFSQSPSAQWPAGSSTEYLWAAGLWIGAFKNGEPAVTTGQPAFEFRPGRGELDVIYQTRELAPGGARLPSPNANDDRDGQTDEDWLDGRDNDLDGRIDEDFAAISNQMFFSEYWDLDSNIKLSNPEHVPLGFRVQQSSLCWEDPLVDDFIAFDFRLINEGFDVLENVYVGFWADADIGPREGEQIAEDDWGGFWEGIESVKVGNDTKRVKVSIGYMFDDDGDEGDSEGYIGLMFLGAQDPGSGGAPSFVSLRNFLLFSGRAPFEAGGDPNNDEERYRTMAGTSPGSLSEPNPITGLIAPSIAKKKDDYRMLVSVGPFETVEPGDTLSFQSALVIGRFFEGMRDNAVQAQLTFDGAYLNVDEDPSTGVQGRETAVCSENLSGQIFRINPCDSTCDDAPTSDPECYVRVPTEGCEWINGDCDFESFTLAVTGIQGKETLVHWLIGTAPPPPKMRIIANENQIDILFDNLSETTPDLRQNVLDFESYRIWRADNWTRPFGTDVNTGPGSSLWMLLAEFDLPNNGIGSDTGLESIRYAPAIPADAVEFYREWFAAHPFLQPPDLPGFTAAEIDTAKALSEGRRYYKYTDPPFSRGGVLGDPCSSGDCSTILTPNGPVNARCNAQGRCQQTAPPPHSGAHYFYGVSATDHKLRVGADGRLEAAGPGLAGDPNSNFVFVNPPTGALSPDRFDEADEEIYVVPNPATLSTLSPWTLLPNNDDPTGTKVEFHHLPQSRGKVTVYTLSGDVIIELPYDASDGRVSLAWDLLSRNGQEVTSGIYMFSVEAENPDFDTFVGKFVVIR